MEFVFPAILFTLGSIILLGLFIRIPKRSTNNFRGSISTSLLLILLSLTFLIPTDWQLFDAINRTVIASIIGIITTISIAYTLFSYLTFHPRKAKIQTAWYIGGAIWLTVYIISIFVANRLSANTLPTISTSSIPIIIGLIGTGLLGGTLVAIFLWDYFRVTLPELANRSAFWVVVALFCGIGIASIISGLPTLAIPGLLFVYLALLGLFYGYRTTRILDVRSGFVLSIRNITILSLLTMSILITIYSVDRLNLTNSTSGVLTIIGISVIISAVILPLVYLVQDIFKNLTDTVQTSLSDAIAAYSREVSLSTNLEEVVTATTTTLNHVINIRRSGLILINNTFRKENAVEFVVLSGVPTLSGINRVEYISKNSPLYQIFAKHRAAITQFDIDFDPSFASIPPSERKFFQSLYLQAYAPIVTENNLIGIIGCGPKLDDTAYTPDELELLLVIGQQVGIALRSARLIDDLRHLNTSMRSLNSQLQVAKQDLEKLDSIKTDFVTIASHELRTPLAQVRGYSDIIDSLNEQGILDAEQTTSLVNNLRRATERMEELISAMMDVSQLDVNAMDLRLVSTKPDTIIKLALDPLLDAIEQRKLTLERKDISELPAIQADMQRMVQAVSNILVNAIKFTPDAGTIEIAGKTEIRDETDHVVITIKDTGVGIHPHDLDLIFQKFYRGFDPQLHSTGTYKFMGAGPGLGTTIAKGIIEGHGGKVWAESTGHDLEKLPGTTFYISMPIKPPEDAKRVLPFEPENSEVDIKTAEITAINSTDGSSLLEKPTNSEKTAEMKKP